MVMMLINGDVKTMRKKGESIDDHINRHYRAVKEAKNNWVVIYQI